MSTDFSTIEKERLRTAITAYSLDLQKEINMQKAEITRLQHVRSVWPGTWQEELNRAHQRCSALHAEYENYQTLLEKLK